MPNLENEQVIVMKTIIEQVQKLDIPIEMSIIWGGDFNFILDAELEASRRNPKLKVKSIETLKSIMEDLDLCDIWRIRNPKTNRYTWRAGKE